MCGQLSCYRRLGSRCFRGRSGLVWSVVLSSEGGDVEGGWPENTAQFFTQVEQSLLVVMGRSVELWGAQRCFPAMLPNLLAKEQEFPSSSLGVELTVTPIGMSPAVTVLQLRP